MVVIALEGNGSRPSHNGDGFSEGGRMFTLNTIERHSVCYAIQGNMVDRNTLQGGSGISKDVCPTLNTQDKHACCYGISRSMLTGGMNAGGIPIGEDIQPAMTANGAAAVCYQIGGPRNAFCETDISRTLDTACLNPGCNEGGMAIIVIDHSRRHSYKPLDVFPTMEAHMGTGGGNVPLVLIRDEADGNLSNDNRSIMCEQPSRELHRTGCVQRYAPGDKEK